MPTLKKDNVTIFYELSGSGIPVLFIQGIGMLGHAWKPQVQGLGTGFQSLIFDNRGIGKSTPCSAPIHVEAMTEDAAELISSVGWSSAHIVGHSMGGVIAQELALQFPKMVRSLSLMCTFARGRDAARLTPWVMWMGMRTSIGTRKMKQKAFLEMVMPREFLQSQPFDVLIKEMNAAFGRDLADQPSIAMKQLGAMRRHNKSDQLVTLKGIPTWVLSAEFDRIAKPEYGRELSRLIPQARFELIDEASHAVTLHKVDEVNAKLKEFILSCE